MLPTPDTSSKQIDSDWLELIMEAKNQGFSQEEIRSLLTILGSK
ncbi:DNA-binding anti-repressor SinI [Bacillus sp. B1-b2]|nr:DNA-binding anti-repressor SinI [Bacillus sp. B1-b2]